MADESGAERVLVQVCVECGKEYTFDADPPPEDLTCEKCGNSVFRSFYDTSDPDDVDEDYRDSTERDLSPDDPAGDATEGDLRDLEHL